MMQLEMGFFQLVAKTEMLNDSLVSRCKSENDAILLCWNKRRVKYGVREAARILGVPASHFSNILNGKKYLPNGFQVTFQVLCGNWAIRQYEDLTIGATTHFETPEQQQIKLLKAELERRSA